MILASVVIPAHNEESVIGRCLDSLLRDGGSDLFNVVVVCNGCTDATAEVARSFGVRVEELTEASKTSAINKGTEMTSAPRIYLDADIELTAKAAAVTVGALAPEVLAAAPRPYFKLDDRPFVVRAFYRAWQRTSFLQDGVVGNGVYALSAEASEVIGTFPAVLSEDLLVIRKIPVEKRVTIPSEQFTISPPRTLSDLIRVRTRVHRGNRQLEQLDDLLRIESGVSNSRALFTGTRTLRDAFDAAIYLGINALAKLRGRKRSGLTWERDLSSRQGK